MRKVTIPYFFNQEFGFPMFMSPNLVNEVPGIVLAYGSTVLTLNTTLVLCERYLGCNSSSALRRVRQEHPELLSTADFDKVGELLQYRKVLTKSIVACDEDDKLLVPSTLDGATMDRFELAHIRKLCAEINKVLKQKQQALDNEN